jgi:hypothetical protein
MIKSFIKKKLKIIIDSNKKYNFPEVKKKRNQMKNNKKKYL